MVNKMSFAQFREIALKRRTIRDFKKGEVNPKTTPAILALYSYEKEEYKNNFYEEIINCDIGLALQNICLGLYLKGYGSCIVKSFNQFMLNKLLFKPKHQLRILLAWGRIEKTPLPPKRKEIKAYLI